MVVRGEYNVMTQWYTGTGQWYSPTLQGGMKYSNGEIIVPQDGLYYIYMKLQFKPSTPNLPCHMAIRVLSQTLNVDYIIKDDADSVDHYFIHYTGIVRKLHQGDSVVARSGSSTCNFNFNSARTHFGVFKVG